MTCRVGITLFPKTEKETGMMLGLQKWHPKVGTNQMSVTMRTCVRWLLYWVLVSEPGCFKDLAHFPRIRILSPEMKPRNNIVY